MVKVTIKDMMEKARQMLWFEEEKEGILFLLEHDLRYYLKGFGYQGFQRLREHLTSMQEIAQEDNDQKMIKVYSIMLYLIKNLEDYYFSRLFESYFDI
jgi:hypothetical protein